jgi:hypothetical protein
VAHRAPPGDPHGPRAGPPVAAARPGQLNAGRRARGREVGYPPTVPTPDKSESPVRRAAAKAGFVASAFIVFLCGWLAMRADAWPRILLYTVLALGAAALTSYFRRAGQ